MSCTSAAENACTGCNVNFYFDSVNKKCVQAGQCPDQYYSNLYGITWQCTKGCGPYVLYADPVTKSCVRCDKNCLSCSGILSTQCTQCFSGKAFLDTKTNTCVVTCPDSNTYGNLQTTKCETCWSEENTKCKTCSGGGDYECKSCFDGFIFDDGHCVKGDSSGAF